MGVSAALEKKSFGYGGFEGSKLDAGAFAEDAVVESHEFTARRHSPHELISGETNCSSRGMSSAVPVGFGFGQGTASGNAARIQISDLQQQHANDNECSPEEEDQSEGGGFPSGHRKKELKRTWREEWKTRHRWVYPVKNADGELRLKCTWCTYFNMDNVFAREGCSTIQMSALHTHARSEAHKAAENRIGAPDVTTLPLPDTLFEGSKSGGESGLSQMDGADAMPGKKRKMLPVMGAKTETLASIIHKNNSRVVQLLVDAENGRNARHATNVGLAKKQIKLEEQRLQVEQQLLEQDKARFAAQVSLGQSFVSALTDIGEGLKRIGNAMEARKTTLL